MSKTPPFPPNPRTIVFVIFPGFQILDAAGPLAAFEVASRLVKGAYRLRVAALEAGLIASSAQGAAMPAEALSRQRAIDTLIVVGGYGTREAFGDAKLLAAVKRAAARARRTASVCSGAFILAAAGLLAGKRATTHWRRAGDLARLFPDVRVEADCIHIQDGDVWTSAGVTAGIDLALAMIAADLGEKIAEDTAREMVVYAKRPGGQAQHSALLDLDAPRFNELNAWMRAHLKDDLSVERLAAKAGMSPRNFARAYAAETGVTPAKAVGRLRADSARAMLQRGGALQEIAAKTGFHDPERMRRAFVRLYGAPPAAMRRTLRRA
jgi:transcriptional regulator GlxA family with amidase domain